MYCDLHMHSVFSDGTDTPESLIQKAGQQGLGAIALCDHNTVSGLPKFLEAARSSSVLAVPGVEFSTEYNGKELHILGLFIKEKYYGEIRELLAASEKRKEESNLDLIHNLGKDGYLLDYEKIKSERPDGRVNRAHIAAELTKSGYTSSIDEAFDRLLGKKHGYYHPAKRLDSLEMIAFLKSIGAAAVWAHPFFNMKTEKEVQEFIDAAKPCGLDGMETIYSTYSQETERLAMEIAKRNGLLQSGGSDYHGKNKPDIEMGTGRGNLRIPMEFYEKLKAVAK